MSDYPEHRCPFRPTESCPWTPRGRDAEVIRLVAKGWSDYAIGKEIGLAPASVSHAIRRLSRMLGLVGRGVAGGAGLRTQLAAYAGQHGLTGTPEP